MLCNNGELRLIKNNRYFFCLIRQNGCPYAWWCRLENTFKMSQKVKDCSNYSKGDGMKIPSPSEKINGKN